MEKKHTNMDEMVDISESSSRDRPDTSSSINTEQPEPYTQEELEDDPIVAEYDVYLSNTLSDKLFLLQYPLLREYVYNTLLTLDRTIYEH